MRVTFHEYAKTIFLEDVAAEYKADLWYSKHETSSFKADVASEIRQMWSSQAILGDRTSYAALLISQDNFVGLEDFLTTSQHQEIADRKEEHVRAILLEQKRQTLLGICDPDLIAKISEIRSEKSRVRASIIGQIHQM